MKYIRLLVPSQLMRHTFDHLLPIVLGLILQIRGTLSSPASSSTTFSPPNLSSIPEEIRQEIISYLDFPDAWSLKQTSRLFYQVSHDSQQSDRPVVLS